MSAVASLPTELEQLLAASSELVRMRREIEAVARVLRSAGCTSYPYGMAPVVERIIGERDRARIEIDRLRSLLEET